MNKVSSKGFILSENKVKPLLKIDSPITGKPKCKFKIELHENSELRKVSINSDGKELGSFVIQDFEEPATFLSFLNVEKEYQGLGLGTDLINYGIAISKAVGCTAMTLQVFDHNKRARALYERLGFFVCMTTTGHSKGKMHTMTKKI